MSAISPTYGVGADQFTDEDMELARRVVAVGAETLDNYHQNLLEECGYFNQDARQWWVGKIDWDILNLDDQTRCILGQIFGDYSRGVDKLVTRHPDCRDDCPCDLNTLWAASNGFFTSPDSDEYDPIPFGALEIAWVEVRDSAVG